MYKGPNPLNGGVFWVKSRSNRYSPYLKAATSVTAGAGSSYAEGERLNVVPSFPPA